jgi:uncharacterized protein
MMQAPYLAAFNTTRAFLPAMLARRRGVLLHVNSPAALQPWPGATGYAAARWALRGLHEALDMDLHGTGVRSCHVVFSEVSSAYFDANPGTRDRLPGIGRLIPTSTPEQCARVLLRTIDRPRRQVISPLALRLSWWSQNLAPWATRALVRTTGYRRTPDTRTNP